MGRVEIASENGVETSPAVQKRQGRISKTREQICPSLGNQEPTLMSQELGAGVAWGFREMLRASDMSLVTLEVKAGPLSVWMVCDTPNRGMVCSRYDDLSHHICCFPGGVEDPCGLALAHA